MLQTNLTEQAPGDEVSPANESVVVDLLDATSCQGSSKHPDVGSMQIVLVCAGAHT
uniref:hypothetical protein n=1 Tax=Mycolicibacterium sp. CBMA 213 TaxID=1968788 RepID=UPI00155DBE1E|nr:hypothetical protein [Mycolicibacterium sp. CBMA 213]